MFEYYFNMISSKPSDNHKEPQHISEILEPFHQMPAKYPSFSDISANPQLRMCNTSWFRVMNVLGSRVLVRKKWPINGQSRDLHFRPASSNFISTNNTTRRWNHLRFQDPTGYLARAQPDSKPRQHYKHLCPVVTEINSRSGDVKNSGINLHALWLASQWLTQTTI